LPPFLPLDCCCSLCISTPAGPSWWIGISLQHPTHRDRLSQRKKERMGWRPER
jgi:hypothetical protein